MEKLLGQEGVRNIMIRIAKKEELERVTQLAHLKVGFEEANKIICFTKKL